MWVYHVVSYPKSTYTYAHHEGKDLKLDLYLPQAGSLPYPTIIYIHGGGWVTGSRKNIEPGIVRQVKNGYAVAAVSYSLLWSQTFPEQIFEVKAAIRWLKASAHEFDLNSRQFIVWGVSAGGHIANMIGATSGTSAIKGQIGYQDMDSDVIGVISWYPITHLHHYGEGLSNNFITRWIFRKYMSNQSFHANPINYISQNTPPFYIAHGRADRLVDVYHSTSLYQALVNQSIPCRLELFDNFYHADWRMNYEKHLKEVQIFLRQVTKA